MCYLLCACGSGCAHVPRQPLGAPQPLPPELAAYYDYAPHTHQATVTLLRTHRGFRESLVHFPLIAPGFEPTEPTVEFEWMESTWPGRRAAIIFNPILGGDYPLERGMCRYLAARGFHVALLHRKTLKISPEHPVDHLELLLRQGVLRMRQVVDWVAANDRVDPARIGSEGISMGGMASVMLAAVEPRVRAHFVALAGGSIPDILATSRDKLILKPRARYLQRNSMDQHTLDRQLREAIRTDPLRLAPYVDPRTLFMTIALSDRTIGRANAFRLWEALGRPPVVLLPTGHYTSYLFLPYLNVMSLHFFRRTLQ